MSAGHATAVSPVRAVVVVLALTVAALAASIAVGVAVIVPAAFLEYDVFSLPVQVAALVAGQLGFFAVGYLYASRHDIRVPISWPTGRSVGYVVVGTPLALLVAAGGIALLEVLDVMPDSVIEETAVLDPVFLLALAVLSVVLVAPVEEYLFRGVVQGRLRESLGPVAAILVASLLFGAMHFANYTGSPVQILAGVLLVTSVGIVLGAVYELTDNLTVPILVHAIYNVVLLVPAYFAL